MLSGRLYCHRDPELVADFIRGKEITQEYNTTTVDQQERRTELIRMLFESVGENVKIEPPLHCDYGCHITVGDNFYANYNCIFLDVSKVKIGNDVMFGPEVKVFAAGHPIDAAVRDAQLEFGKPITIGNSVWVGGGSIINPGVTIGDNVVIGAGSVVVRDIPSNSVAVGNPCRVIRKISDADKAYWETLREEYNSDK